MKGILVEAKLSSASQEQWEGEDLKSSNRELENSMQNPSSLSCPRQWLAAPDPYGHSLSALAGQCPIHVWNFQVERQIGRGQAGVDGGRELGKKGDEAEHTQEWQFLFIKLSTHWQNRLSWRKSFLGLNWTGLVLTLCSISHSFISLPGIILYQRARWILPFYYFPVKWWFLVPGNI